MNTVPTNWIELTDLLVDDKLFTKLAQKVSKLLSSYQKSDKSFDLLTIKPNHMDNFTNFVLHYQQMKLETDTADILVEIPELNSALSKPTSITFNLIATGKWIKFIGATQPIFFFDEDETVMSDKTYAEFLNKITEVRRDYLYYGCQPMVYCKFAVMPTERVVEYSKRMGVICIAMSEKTLPSNHDLHFDERIVLDQSMVITLCSDVVQPEFNADDLDLAPDLHANLVSHYFQLQEMIENHEIYINENVNRHVIYKIENVASPSEVARYHQLAKSLTIVPDITNPRFYLLNKYEQMQVSTAEQQGAKLITENVRLGTKLANSYPEIAYHQLQGSKLAADYKDHP